MAAGIDAESHLAASGRTIAVLGQGIASAMPRWQGMLRERILAAGGLVISEFADDQPGSTWSFPRRNRVIAALARATVVVEAAARSGSKITAQHALDLGRDVWAVPGPPDSPTFAGCLDLIEDGAQVVRAVDELGGLILPNGPPLVPTH
jgi:DNA processing protein